jgi:hypothetical protein
MGKLLFFILGALLGGVVITVVMCCLQINRNNAYEAEIGKLKMQLGKEKGNSNLQ